MQEGFKKSDIEILVSTMNRTSLDFLVPMFPFSHFSEFSIVVINQTTPDKTTESPYPSVRVINSFDKGLSKSRNLALDNSKCNLCVIADDDVVYEPDFEESILLAYNQNPEAALISFRVKTPKGVLFKKYSQERVTANFFQRLNIMSIEMVVNRMICDTIRFNENFGLGARFPMGEEAIFINELHKKKLAILNEPATIVTHPEITSNDRVTVEEKYYIQGALFTALFGNRYLKWLFLKLIFDIKQKKLKSWQIKDAFKSAATGRKDLLKTNENNN